MTRRDPNGSVRPKHRIRTGTKWGRVHANGWVVLVMYEGGGYYGYTVIEPGKLMAAAAESHLTIALHEAKARAERAVPIHDCGCPDWKCLRTR